jgi:hypothetical protein
MGIRKGQGKNKKSNRPATAIAVKRDETIRRAAKDSAKPRSKGMR